MPNPHDPRSVAEELYASFGAGDIAAVIDLLHDDVVWELVGPSDIPYFGRYEGRDRVGEFFELLGRWCVVEDFAVDRITPTEGGAVAEGRERGHFAERETSYDMRWCHVMRIEGGRIIEFTDYLDTAPMIAAWRA